MQMLSTPTAAANWLKSQVHGSLHTDSRRLQPGDGFMAWPGQRFDARSQVSTALTQGVAACLVEADGAQNFGWRDERVAAYAGLKADSGPIASAYFEHPSQRLRMLAVTGTNGKTSSTWWLAQALAALPQGAMPCALVGTLGMGVLPHLQDHGLTTPDAVALQVALAGFVQQGVQACAIEASSVGLEEHRLDGTQIHTAVFTNLTQDHLDYHGDMAAYGRAKKRLFTWPGLQVAVLNIDDAFGAQLAQELASSNLDLWTVSMAPEAQGRARLWAQDISLQANGLAFTVGEAGQQARVQTVLIGSYNVANVLGVIATLRGLGVSLADAAQACQALTSVPGRMQCVRAPGQALVVVDYAHTPDALAKALQALRPMVDNLGGRLWCVFGCGGDRDAAKRPLMGAVAASQADHVVLTNDNPRSESPDAIISQILLGMAGVPEVEVQPDRALAIAQTLAQCGAHDVVLLAGKGHETYQETAGVRVAFSDVAEVRRVLAQPVKGQA
jgi:UDP-N-acetylmuramyl-tripeptide synthetase